jgi:uncharacterized protein YaeQ
MGSGFFKSSRDGIWDEEKRMWSSNLEESAETWSYLCQPEKNKIKSASKQAKAT